MEQIAENLFTMESLIALGTLTALEIVLGIDNIVFISILVEKLEKSKQHLGRQVGLLLAMLMRIGLLFVIKWVMGLEAELFAIFGHGWSGRELILVTGGLFLIGKATFEMHDKLEGANGEDGKKSGAGASFAGVIVQILVLDLVFSIDSVITAVGMADHIEIMITAVVISVGVMMIFAGPIGRFVGRHPTLKMLALAFLILIGFTLVLEGWGGHVNKGYIYFAMAFSLAVELLNLKVIKNIKSGRRARRA